MKKAISHFSLITCIILTFISNNVNAQSSPVEEAIPPIIDLILNSNSAPVNTVPLEPFSPIDGGAFFIIAPIPVISVNDLDRNLISINITNITTPAQPNDSFELLIANSPSIVFEPNVTDEGFTIYGPQDELIDAIQGLSILEIERTGATTFLITSTDSQGATDVDTFVLNPTLPSFLSNLY